MTRVAAQPRAGVSPRAAPATTRPQRAQQPRGCSSAAVQHAAHKRLTGLPRGRGPLVRSEQREQLGSRAARGAQEAHAAYELKFLNGSFPRAVRKS